MTYRSFLLCITLQPHSVIPSESRRDGEESRIEELTSLMKIPIRLLAYRNDGHLFKTSKKFLNHYQSTIPVIQPPVFSIWLKQSPTPIESVLPSSFNISHPKRRLNKKCSSSFHMEYGNIHTFRLTAQGKKCVILIIIVINVLFRIFIVRFILVLYVLLV